MLSSRLYYYAKPYLPWSLRMAVRRAVARVQRRRHAGTWPINELAGRAPEGWPGWPGGKKFALVLTHDVEGQRGLAKCRELMRMEKRLGFRSSFNFVPEGDYRVSADLREELSQNGFEVGVHDLRHDGKLYWGRKNFSANAGSINRYLKEWGAKGFRSGFMLHNRECLHDLDILYDSSTFDTDPFEPQPFGIHTIFPFWESRPGGGFAELPYTLPQDSTLYLLLREKNAEIWHRKLDWLVKNGGMALLNVHPDYVHLPGEPRSARTYPLDLYTGFLDHLRQRYAGQYWHPLPVEAAQFAAAHQLTPPRKKPIRVCMITHSYYESDNRVTRYAEALAQRGDSVDVIALRRNLELPVEENISGVKLHRCQLRLGKNEKTQLAYLRPLLRFLFTSSLLVARRHRQEPYDLVHVHNIPDFMVFAAWYPKFRGAKVLLDIHDIVPEFYASKFGRGHVSMAVKVLKRVERLSARFADHVILANDMWLDTYISRSAARRKCSVFINYVDTRIFQQRPRTRDDGKLIVLFPGGLQWHQGIDIAIHSFKQISARLPNAEFHIYGDGNMKAELVAQVKRLDLDGRVCFFEPLRIRQIAEVMAGADLGVVPKRADSFGNEAYSTKIMEFMSLGVPVVISSTKIDRYYFDDSVARFFESGNPDALAAEMLDVLQNQEVRRRLIANALVYVNQNNWEQKKDKYLGLVDFMIGSRAITPGPVPPVAPPALSAEQAVASGD